MANKKESNKPKSLDYKDAESMDKAASDFNLSPEEIRGQGGKGASTGREGRSGVQQGYLGETIGPKDNESLGDMPPLTPGKTSSRGKPSDKGIE